MLVYGTRIFKQCQVLSYLCILASFTLAKRYFLALYKPTCSIHDPPSYKFMEPCENMLKMCYSHRPIIGWIEPLTSNQSNKVLSNDVSWWLPR